MKNLFHDWIYQPWRLNDFFFLAKLLNENSTRSSKFKVQNSRKNSTASFDLRVRGGFNRGKDFTKRFRQKLQIPYAELFARGRASILENQFRLCFERTLSLSLSHCVALWLFQLSLTFDLLFCPRCRFLCKFRQQNRCAPKGEPLIWSRELHVRLG